jgi:hypothetical protein
MFQEGFDFEQKSVVVAAFLLEERITLSIGQVGSGLLQLFDGAPAVRPHGNLRD